MPPAKRPTSDVLRAHFKAVEPLHLRDLFDREPDRFDRMHLRVGPLLCDYSKHRISHETLPLLCGLARQHGVEAARERMFAGEAINETEQRPALHVALRAPASARIEVNGHNVVDEVHAVRKKMASFVARVHNGDHRGATGKRIRFVVNLGIGGSDLGPVMATEALRPFARPELKVFFVSNVDGAHLTSVLAQLVAEETLFVVASKTFTTQETMANATSAKAWLAEHGIDGKGVSQHFVGLSSNAQACRAFGLHDELRFGFWPWVGGRYSMWSAVGLSIALCIGNEHFEALLAGARAMDEHFVAAPLEQNMPVLLALLGHWYVHYFGAETHAVLPYAQDLHRLPAYLQQLDMESNGKSVRMDGTPVYGPTGPILWGEPGTNGQHAFYQLLHQGTHLVPADFIVCRKSETPMGDHHRLLVANCLAQSAALMRGRTAAEAAAQLESSGAEKARAEALGPHRAFAGNRPSTTMVLERLDPFGLGQLIALYEHKVFVQGVIWGINSFDQWGVELGKELANAILSDSHGRSQLEGQHDSSTMGLWRAVAP